MGGLLIGALAWWWLARDGDAPARDSSVTEAATDPEPEGLWLYRWRDDAGVLQVTDTPPAGRRYERIDRQPRDGLQVDGRR